MNGPPPASQPVHVTVQIVVLFVLCGLSFLTLLSVALNVAMMVTRYHPMLTPAHSSYDMGRQVGHWIGLAMPAVCAVLNLAWAPINAWGLMRRRSWAATSTMVFWGLSIVTVCCAPFGIYGIIAMTRPSVRSWLSSPPP